MLNGFSKEEMVTANIATGGHSFLPDYVCWGKKHANLSHKINYFRTAHKKVNSYKKNQSLSNMKMTNKGNTSAVIEEICME